MKVTKTKVKGVERPSGRKLKNLEKCSLKVGQGLRLEVEVTFDKSHVKDDLPALIRYAGMPNKETFSIGYLFGVREINLYYPKETKKLELLGLDIEVEKVTPEKILLKYLK